MRPRNQNCNAGNEIVADALKYDSLENTTKPGKKSILCLKRNWEALAFHDGAVFTLPCEAH
jgi:hypothetical protein